MFKRLAVPDDPRYGGYQWNLFDPTATSQPGSCSLATERKSASSQPAAPTCRRRGRHQRRRQQRPRGSHRHRHRLTIPISTAWRQPRRICRRALRRRLRLRFPGRRRHAAAELRGERWRRSRSRSHGSRRLGDDGRGTQYPRSATTATPGPQDRAAGTARTWPVSLLRIGQQRNRRHSPRHRVERPVAAGARPRQLWRIAVRHRGSDPLGGRPAGDRHAREQ